MIRRDIVVIGASVGGVEALKVLVAGLPSTLSAALLTVLHRPIHGPSTLREILERVGSLPVSYPEDGDLIVPRQTYLATADKHLSVKKRIRLTNGAKENHPRPAIDVLFRFTSASFGPGVIGIVLSGYLNDGTAGLRAVKDAGGVAVVQSPEEAQRKPMPLSAIQHVAVDRVLPVADLANEIIRLVEHAALP